jgi:hypothetical protein
MEDVKVKIYLVKDSFNNKDACVVSDSCETVQVCGMKDKNGESLYFESDAYHLDNWCAENGLEIKIVDHSHNFNDLWNS